MPKMTRGSSHSAPLMSLWGNMACGKAINIALATAEAMKAASMPSATTWAWGLSVAVSCWARPRFRPMVESCAASSTTITAKANRPSNSGP